MSADSNSKLLDVRDLRVAFGGKEVVRGASFSIAPGEKLALVGESGSGKTITALSLLRLVGDAKLQGQAMFESANGNVDLLALSERQLRGIRGKEIAMIFQEPMTALNPLLTIGDQIAETLSLKEGMTRHEAWQTAVKLLGDTGIPEPERRANSYPHQLSGGQRQRAMISMALACKPRLLLADEPTTALDVTLRAQILELLGDLQKKTGMAVLLITHDLNLVRKFADRVVVMENGNLVEQGVVGDVFANPQHAYTKKLIDSKPTRDLVADASSADAVVLKSEHLRVAYPVPKPGVAGWFGKGEFIALQDASFQIQRGQTLGIVGESGSGKSTLALAVLGLQKSSGMLDFENRTWGKSTDESRSIRRDVQVVFQDPYSSLSPRMTIEEIVGEGVRLHMPKVDAAGRQKRVIEALKEVGLDEAQYPALLQRFPHEFSGGQRQRIAIARALILEPQVLVLDEPTSALDVTIQKQVLSLLQRLQKERGLSYLLITHDVDVVRAMAHCVMVLKDGVVLESGATTEVLDSPKNSYTQALVAAAV